MALPLLFSDAVMRQHTIRKVVSLEGVGLHSGKTVRVMLAPAPADSGIVFRVGERGDAIPAVPESVVDSHYATTIGKNGTRIQTIEHLMAAASGLGIDNLEVRVDGTELPAADGSAKPFVQIMLAAGRMPQSARLRPI
ncbi:MAG: UDP-3-O-[3-hydroxymyristoyl] N-acetylglucosamine deacetylase, partial [Candidatus Rokuibacteriota bacterium]